MPPQVNAELVAISTEESTTMVAEDWDVAPSAAPLTPNKFVGPVGAYVMEKIRTVYSDTAGGLLKQKDASIIIDAYLLDVNGNRLAINTGDIVTYTFKDVTYTRRVMDWAAPYLPGLPQEYIRIHLNPEPVETALDME